MKTSISTMAVAAVLLSLASAPTPAAGPGSAAGQLSGAIDYVDAKQGKVVIDDTTYLVAPTVPVAAFKKGTKVGFIVTQPAGSQRPVIAQMWPLPAGASGGNR
jgi:hypothetical protein